MDAADKNPELFSMWLKIVAETQLWGHAWNEIWLTWQVERCVAEIQLIHHHPTLAKGWNYRKISQASQLLYAIRSEQVNWHSLIATTDSRFQIKTSASMLWATRRLSTHCGYRSILYLYFYSRIPVGCKITENKNKSLHGPISVAEQSDKIIIWGLTFCKLYTLSEGATNWLLSLIALLWLGAAGLNSATKGTQFSLSSTWYCLTDVFRKLL